MRAEPRVPAQALAAIRAPFIEAGAERVDPPILQPLSLLLELAGEALRARLFVVQSEGGEEACLRPDFTVPVARLHLASGAAEGRYFYEGTAFRAAPESADRPEEFLQVGLEIYESGMAPAAATDAEVAALAWRAAAAGGRKDLTLWLGDVGLFAALIDGLGLAPSLAARMRRAAARPRLLAAELARAGAAPEATQTGALAARLAGLSEREAAALLEEIWALAGIERVGGRGPAEIAQRLVRKAEAAQAPALTPAQADAVKAFLAIAAPLDRALEAVDDIGGEAPAISAALGGWAERVERLLRAGAPVDRLWFAAGLGHTFDYYDGLTFEVRSEALGAERPVAVGGRYDSLPARLGGANGTRAVGAMVRPWRAFAGGEA
ncbi:ATP phosphoribosyltransferase regulatory subunit [Phenylobacterium sp.]|uniref:ATP phosphoribosyltransferase regulatory subunit n=1 Tax=Phenylobacterium sp. TaxID=1871053 RepID=UPI002E35D6FC|nr:ATP phosphoribosyltransferase regulatory subunit [Phenylobacterium sp.]HEX2560083.1 ATP phosphoribosyltransferase regulatory subunit [Phenylobacterium sp.]